MKADQQDGRERSADAPPAKKTYVPPTLVAWGTLRDLTQSVGTSGASDGATKGPRRQTR
jgi:hypothetical protein